MAARGISPERVMLRAGQRGVGTGMRWWCWCWGAGCRQGLGAHSPNPSALRSSQQRGCTVTSWGGSSWAGKGFVTRWPNTLPYLGQSYGSHAVIAVRKCKMTTGRCCSWLSISSDTSSNFPVAMRGVAKPSNYIYYNSRSAL